MALLSVKRILNFHGYACSSLNFQNIWMTRSCASIVPTKKSKLVGHAKPRHVPLVVSQNIRKDLFANVAYKDRIIAAQKPWLTIPPKSAAILKSITNKETSSDVLPLSGMEMEELVAFVTNVVPLQRPESRKNLCNALENECCKRIRNMDERTMLYFADVFFVLNSGSEKYFRAVFQEFERRWSGIALTKEDVLQLAFFLSIVRSSSIFLMHGIEEFVGQNMNVFTIGEISLICHAFFTTNTAFRSFATVDKLSNLVLTNLNRDRFRLVHIVNIMKTMRHAHFSRVAFYEELGDVLSRRLSTKESTLSDLATLSFTFASLRILHPNFLRSIKAVSVEMLSGDSWETSRMKDLGRLIWSFVMMSEPVPDFLLQKLPDIMRKDIELSTRYPEVFVEALVALAVNKVYPTDLIDRVFSQGFLALKSSRLLEQNFQLLLLNKAVQVECPSYTGNYLTQQYLRSCPKELFGNLRYDISTRQGLLTLIHTLQKILGDSSYFRCHFILDHSRITDVELQLDSLNRPLKFNTTHEEDSDIVKDTISQSTVASDVDAKRLCDQSKSSISHALLEESQDETQRDLPENIFMKTKIPQKNRKISIKVFGWNQYALNKPVLLGLHQMELRLLTLYGYDVYTVSPSVATELDDSSAKEQETIVRNILEKCHVRL